VRNYLSSFLPKSLVTDGVFTHLLHVGLVHDIIIAWLLLAGAFSQVPVGLKTVHQTIRGLRLIVE
jgi:hypothetical protein